MNYGTFYLGLIIVTVWKFTLTYFFYLAKHCPKDTRFNKLEKKTKTFFTSLQLSLSILFSRPLPESNAVCFPLSLCLFLLTPVTTHPFILVLILTLISQFKKFLVFVTLDYPHFPPTTSNPLYTVQPSVWVLLSGPS